METCKVLLVDDEEESVTTLTDHISLRGVKTGVAFTGKGALRAPKSEDPYVVTVDVLPPGMGGLEILRRVRRNHPVAR